MSLIFISYQRQSEPEALELHDKLTEAGFTVWQDVKSIRHTDRWSLAIDSALRNADRLILLLTPESMESHEVFNEWFFFYNKRKPIHCLMLKTCDPHFKLLPFQWLDWRLPNERNWDRLCTALQATFDWPSIAETEKIIRSKFAPSRTEAEALNALLQAVQNKTDVVALSDEQIDTISNRHPTDLTEYWLTRIAEWSLPRYQLDNRFVQLQLFLDQGEDTEGRRWIEDNTYDDLRELLTDISDLAMVVLGAPGSGKSTLLRKLESNLAIEQIRNDGQQVSFFIQLNEYHSSNGVPTPMDWLVTEWAKRCPGLPALIDLLRQGRMLLLLDGLNEMQHKNMDEYSQRIAAWQQCLLEIERYHSHNRVIFSCRSLDYSSPLSSNALPVPQIQVKPMDNQRIQQFLAAYLPEQAGIIWKELQGSPQLTLFRTPYLLKLLVDQIRPHQNIPKDQAALFAGFVRQALIREIQNKNPLFEGENGLLTQDDLRLLNNPRWQYDYNLPEDGPLIERLSQLAFKMQNRLIQADGGQIRIKKKEAFELLQHEKQEAILDAGISLNVLDKQTSESQTRRQTEILFFHQLLQEFFAARQLALEPDPEKVRVEWQTEYIKPSLSDVLAKIPDSEPLPPPPPTGWEETTVLASAMSDDPDQFIRDLMRTNLPIAARCASSPNIKISAKLKTDLQHALIERIANPLADLRARMTAGFALGNLGDPRFELCTGLYGDYLLPPMVTIPTGAYQIGDDGDHIDESPMHTVHLDAFQIGLFPVTNAEYKLFIDSGGYTDERWWETPEANHWRLYGADSEPIKEYWRDLQRRFDGTTMDEGYMRELLQQGHLTPQEAEDALTLIGWTDERLDAWLTKTFSSAPRAQPRYWEDSMLNNPAQPVVGVCWYEANAYCAWLNAQVGESLPFRLLTESEFEAAARGFEGRQYAYGDVFDVTRCNSVETHIRRTSPIGVFHNATPEGVFDLSGNVWTWTSTTYRPYPYNANDGRESSTGVKEGRVQRGGAYYYRSSSLRGACRSSDLAENGFDDLGFRCARTVVSG